MSNTRVAAPQSTAADIESPYAWLRLAVSLMLMTIGGSGMYSVTVVLPRIQADFGIDRADASLPYTLTMIGFGVGGILMGRLADRFGVLVPVAIGAFGLGALFGLVASPCSTPVLAVIATMAAAGRSPTTGAVLLFVYGLGKGVPLLLIGLASGSMRAMRPLSRATPILTKFGGVALIGVAAYLTFTA